MITGGSSRLGKAFVRTASREGAHVFFTYFEHGRETEGLEELGAKGYALDLSDMRAIEAFARSLKKEIPCLDVLIHNAAAIRDRTLQNMSEEEWDHVLTVDLKAPYYLTKELLSLLFAKGASPTKKIFFMISRLATQGGYGVSNYAAAKAGLVGLAKSLAMELGRKKFLVNVMNPGFMKSRMTENLPESVLEKNLSESSLEKYSDPEEVAEFLTYLCSDKMSQMTGQVLHFESRLI